MNVLIVAAGAAGAFLFLLTSRFIKQKRRKEKSLRLAKAYSHLVIQQRIIVDYSESIGNRVIAFDRKNKKLLLVDHSGTQPLERCIALRTISYTRIKEEKTADGSTSRLVLELHQKYSKSVDTICFFDSAFDDPADLPQVSGQALHWKTKIDIHRHSRTIALGAEYVL